MAIKELKDFIIHENYYRSINFPKGNSCYSMKHQGKTNLLLFVTKLIEKNLMLLMLNETINLI